MNNIFTSKKDLPVVAGLVCTYIVQLVLSSIYFCLFCLALRILRQNFIAYYPQEESLPKDNGGWTTPCKTAKCLYTKKCLRFLKKNIAKYTSWNLFEVRYQQKTTEQL